MADQVNKDLLIAVMSRQQQEQEKMIKLQAEQLDGYREHVAGYKVLMQNYEQQVAGIEKQVSHYKQVEANLNQTIAALTELNNQLSSKLEILERMIQLSEEAAHSSPGATPDTDAHPVQ